MSRKYKSEKGLGAGLVFWGTILLLIGIVFYDYWENGRIDHIWLHVFDVSITFLLLWIWFDTGYEITDKSFNYKSGPFRGSVPINQITKLVKNKTQWAGTKVALATRGIIVQYNCWDEIYISPHNQDQFIKDLTALNQTIKVAE